MTRSGEVRDVIIAVLSASGGTITDSKGRCTNIITDRCQFDTPQVSAALQGLERSGRITRNVRGKRTYRVALVKLAEAEPPAPPLLELVPDTDEQPPSVDLHELAGAMLARCAEILEGPKLAQVDAERLANSLDEAQRMRGKLRSAEQELEGMRSERNTLRERVRLLEGDKRNLQANLDHALSNGGKIVHEQVRKAVDEFMRETPTRHENTRR